MLYLNIIKVFENILKKNPTEHNNHLIAKYLSFSILACPNIKQISC